MKNGGKKSVAFIILFSININQATNGALVEDPCYIMLSDFESQLRDVAARLIHTFEPMRSRCGSMLASISFQFSVTFTYPKDKSA